MKQQNTQLQQALLLLNKHFKENTKEILQELKKHAPEDLEEEIKRQTTPKIPISIFQTPLTPYQAIIQYYHEQEYTTKQIARLLQRTTSSVNATRKQAHNKQVKLPTTANTYLHLDELDTNLAPAEAIINALRKKGRSNKEVAQLLNKDPRNTWKVYQRAKRKRGELQ